MGNTIGSVPVFRRVRRALRRVKPGQAMAQELKEPALPFAAPVRSSVHVDDITSTPIIVHDVQSAEIEMERGKGARYLRPKVHR